MNGNKLMILGAGVYQVPLINKARELGLKTIVVSIPGQYPGFKLADVTEFVDIRNAEKVLVVARKYSISGICTTGSDVGVRTMGFVNDALGLCGVSYESAALANNKFEMKQRFAAHKVRVPKAMRVFNISEARVAFLTLNGNTVFKTVDSSGNRGIIHVDDQDHIQEALTECMRHTRCDYILVEEFMAGQEIGAEAFIQNGKVLFVLPHGKEIVETDAPVPIGQYVPVDFSVETLGDIETQVCRGIRALGLDNCAVNVDIMLRDSKAYLIEMGARAGGGACLPESVSIYYGFDHYANIINAALGNHIRLCVKDPSPNACQFLISRRGGVMGQVAPDIFDLPGLVDLSFDYKPGDKLPVFRNKTDRIGHVIVQASTSEEARQLLKEIVNRVESCIA